jgi:cysteine desulfuration protein SufE
MVQSIEEIIESFALMDDWEDKYTLLIDLGKRLPDFPENMRTDENLVKGCVSRVWMIPEIKDGVFTFQGDSDAHLVKGLVALLHIIYSGQRLSELKNIDVESIFEQISLTQNLSPNRRNGVFSMVEKIRNFSAH